jgi:uncharacterized membrane protein
MITVLATIGALALIWILGGFVYLTIMSRKYPEIPGDLMDDPILLLFCLATWPFDLIGWFG